MYENIGGKIKKLSKAIAVIGIIIAVIAGFWYIADYDEILQGIFIIVLGGLAAWISSLLIYGFGELIEKVSLIEENNRYDKALPTSDSSNKSEAGPKDPVIDEEYKSSVSKKMNDWQNDYWQKDK